MNTFKIFEILPDNFFSILSSTNNKIYADCIFLMYNFLGRGNSFGANKEEIIEILVDYFNSSTSYFDEEEETNTNREKALFVLRRLKQCGWIFEEDESNYEVLINFTYYSISIIKTLSDLKKNDELEYQGYIFLIYSAVKNVDVNTLSDILDQVYHNTNIVMNKLKSLNSNIKKYIQELLNKKDIKDLKSIVENLFIDYKKNIIDDAYQRLKTSDNVSKYRPFIISKLNEISLNDDLINTMCNDLVVKKKFYDIISAKVHIYEKIDYIINSFENFDNIIEEIDKKNAKYIQTSISKILFIVNNCQDLEGKINAILRYCVNKDNNELLEINNLFKLSTQKNLDSLSFYTYPLKSCKITPSKISLKKELTKDEKQNKFKKYLTNSNFSHKNINSYVLNLLKNKKTLKASEININNLYDYTKLILVYMYANSKNISYKIKKLDYKCLKDNFSFVDFEICLK